MELFGEAPNVAPGATSVIKFEDEVENVVSARSTNDNTLVSELYFLIAKFLSRGPLKHTAQTLLKEIESEEVLPRRLDWEGREHAQSFEQLEHQYPEISCRRLIEVCSRALHLAAEGSVPRARLSILGAAVAGARGPRARPPGLLRRVMSRERGDLAPSNARPFPAGLLRGMSLQRRTLGHLSAVYCVVFAGRYVLTGADDFLLKLWSAEDGTLRRTYRGSAAEITDVCVTDDLTLLAAGCVDRAIRLWCVRTGAALAVLTGHLGTVTAVQWRPQTSRGPLLASTSTDGSVAFWSRRDGDQWVPCRLVERTRPGVCHTICAGWSAGGLLLATGSADHKVRVYRLEGDVHRDLEMEAHGDAVDSVRWAHAGLRFVSGSKDGTAALWTLRAGRWRHRLLLRPDAGKQKTKVLKVTMVCWDCSDQYIYIAVSDATIEMWNASSGTMCRTLRGHGDEVYVLEPHPHLTGVFLSAGHDGQLRVWDSAADCPCLSLHTNRVDVGVGIGEGQGELGAVFDAKWSPSGSAVAATDSHGHLMLLGLGRGHHLLRSLPTELFFHTDYRPISRSGSSGLPVDELSGRPPHLLPPPFLVDMEGSPLPGRWQCLVPGRGRGAAGTEDDEEGGDATPESVPAVCDRWLSAQRERVSGMLESEIDYYHREMRRKPHMIATQPRPKTSRRKPTSIRVRVTPELPPDSASSDDEDSSIRLTNTDSDSSTASSVSMKSINDACSSSPYSDWEAPPAPRKRPTRQTRRRRRRSPLPRATVEPVVPDAAAEEAAVPVPPGGPASPPRVPSECAPSAGDWLTSVFPRKTPYQPQIGDECVYFRVGHERYFDAVEEKQAYKLHPRDKPWFRGPIPACELVRVSNIKFSLRPCRVASLRLVTSSGRVFTAKYHDMADVIDFLVLTQHYRTARDRRWKQGDRFRCVIDDCWWTGEVVENCAADECDTDGRDEDESAPGYWERQAKHYLCIVVRWDNGEHDRLSPWDLEPCEGADRPGDAVPLGPGELDGPAYEPAPGEWPHGDRASAAGCLSGLVAQVMCLSAAEPFSTPVDPNTDPAYGTLVHYPIDLATIRARFSNLYYRRLSAAQMDAQYIAINAELISRAGGGGEQLVKRARLVRDVLLAVMADWNTVDVMTVYRKLAKDKLWPETCKKILREVWSSSDAEPFRSPVSLSLAPDYHAIVRNPCDLSLVSERLNNDQYRDQEQFCNDMRLIFRNSRVYNTNKRSRIYMMTARLSDLFESLWSSVPRARCRRRMSSDDDDETLADTSRRQRATGVKWSDVRDARQDASSPQPGTSKQHNAYESESDVPLRNISKRARSSSSETYTPRHNGMYRPNKRGRRASSTSSSSSCSTSSCATDEDEAAGAGAGAAGGRAHNAKRYSSDHSYKPRYSTDDDQPLNKLREQTNRNTTKRKPRVRPPRSAVSYNEESEDESTAAISKRERHARTIQRRSNNMNDHTYHNGHATRQTVHGGVGGGGGASSSSSSESPLSVSQRGRVRRLTEKARGMYRD